MTVTKLVKVVRLIIVFKKQLVQAFTCEPLCKQQMLIFVNI